MVVSIFVTLFISVLVCVSALVHTAILDKDIRENEEIVKSRDIEILSLQEELEKKNNAIEEYKKQIQKLQDEFVDSNCIYQELCDIKKSFAVLETELDILHKVIRKLRDKRNTDVVKVIQEIKTETNKFVNSPYYTFRKYNNYLNMLLRKALKE